MPLHVSGHDDFPLTIGLGPLLRGQEWKVEAKIRFVRNANQSDPGTSEVARSPA
jgi:hypothetical protein